MEAYNLKVVDKLERIDCYITKEWKSEKATRFVLQYPDGKKVESSAFIHYGNENEVLDLTIEVSTMYGCPIKCKFCDTVKINTVRYLTSDEIIMQIEKTLFECALTPNCFSNFRVSFFAIGENSLIPNTIIEASNKLKANYTHISLNLSTVAADISAIDIWSKASLPLRILQVSLLHYDLVELKKVVPNIKYFNTKELADSLIRFKARNPNVRIAINYILVDGFNDSIDYVHKLLEHLETVKEIIHFRLSILNETEGTRKNNLRQVSVDKTQEILETITQKGFIAYIFGSFENHKLSCGQFIGKYNKQ